jgi:hypothetical protein
VIGGLGGRTEEVRIRFGLLSEFVKGDGAIVSKGNVEQVEIDSNSNGDGIVYGLT